MSRSLLVRAAWFLLVGWWATPVVVNVGWLLTVTVVFAPLGVKLVNLTPTVLTLAESRADVDPEGGSSQHSLVVRGAYLLLVGWWLSFLWANAAWVIADTIVGLPVGIWMLNRLPYVTSLYRFHG
jgi:uncharacterized membrane protein YccF (DUF307 family)